MRENMGLHRGKRDGTDAWVEGYLWINETVSRRTAHITTFYGEMYRVDIDTVGQHIGLVDKNGTRVFEQDIVNCSRGCPHEVIFEAEHGGMFIGGMPTFYLKGLDDGYAWTGTEEVLGNIYDNPELLRSES